MELGVNVSGTWHAASQVWAKVSGSWTYMKSGWVNVSGVWKQFYSGFAPHNDVYASGGSSGNATVPLGSANLTIIVTGGGGLGGTATINSSSGDYYGGGSAGSGGYKTQSIAIAQADWGATIAYVVGQAGQNVGGNIATASTTTGSLTNGSVANSAGGGGNGGDGTGSTHTFGSAGTAGSPAGNAGAIGQLNASAPGGAAPYSTYGKGDDGGAMGISPRNGTDGVVVFEWT